MYKLARSKVIMAERIYSQHLGMISDTQSQAALGENLAQLQEVTWPIAGRYNAALDKIEVTLLKTVVFILGGEPIS
jgi:hypothetical protein